MHEKNNSSKSHESHWFVKNHTKKPTPVKIFQIQTYLFFCPSAKNINNWKNQKKKTPYKGSRRIFLNRWLYTRNKEASAVDVQRYRVLVHDTDEAQKMRNFGENRRAPGCAYLDIPKQQTDYQVRTYPLSSGFGVRFLRNPRPSVIRQRSIVLETINTRLNFLQFSLNRRNYFIYRIK